MEKQVNISGGYQIIEPLGTYTVLDRQSFRHEVIIIWHNNTSLQVVGRTKVRDSKRWINNIITAHRGSRGQVFDSTIIEVAKKVAHQLSGKDISLPALNAAILKELPIPTEAAVVMCRNLFQEMLG